MTEINALKKHIQQQADQCVKCGLCANVCPTYHLTHNECEAPRGRIALMDGVAQDRLPASLKLVEHLDHCLNCRACEAVCPADVKYGQLIDNTRQLLPQQQPRLNRLLNWVSHLRHRPLNYGLGRLLQAYQYSGLRHLIQRSGLLKLLKLQSLERLLPKNIHIQRWKNYYPPQEKLQGNVALFTGCVSSLIDQATLQATIKVLTYCGYGVYVPHQYCCGGLHLHAGHAITAQQLAELNQRAFAALDIEQIITVATGCQVTLQEYNSTYPQASLAEFSKKTIDILAFLEKISWPSHLKLQALPQTIAIHVPCSQRNVLRQGHLSEKLLRRIPELKIQAFSNSNYCCGAAGAYMVEQSENAQQLLKQLVDNRCQDQVDMVVTSNIGCLLHLQQAQQQQAFCKTILHPIQVIAQQLCL